MFRNTESGVSFSTLTQWQVKRGIFSSELAVFRSQFSISLTVFRGGLQIWAPGLYGAAPPGVGLIVCILNTVM